MDEEELIYQLALSQIKGVGFNIWSRFIKTFGSAKKVYQDISNSSFLNIQNKTLKLITASIVRQENLEKSEKMLRQHAAEDVKIISFYENDYPENLKNIPSPPCFLYVKGNSKMNDIKTLSIIGSRTPSNYGKEVVKKIVRDISNCNVTIVSGLAYGIDFLAHEESIKNNIPTIAIFAGGLDKIYPSVHKPLSDNIVEQGGMLISEYPLGVMAENFHFPARNRIIAGFSDATLVIEAGVKSGSNITALYANDYDKEVFAVPGNIGNPLSVGCNNLIKKNQAHLITCAQDIIDVMNWQTATKTKPEKKKNSIPNNLDEDSKKILNEFQKNGSLSIDDLLEKTDITMDKLSMLLLQLELVGLIKTLPGNRYENI